MPYISHTELQKRNLLRVAVIKQDSKCCILYTHVRMRTKNIASNTTKPVTVIVAPSKKPRKRTLRNPSPKTRPDNIIIDFII